MVWAEIGRQNPSSSEWEMIAMRTIKKNKSEKELAKEKPGASQAKEQSTTIEHQSDFIH
jgi:hypothetical protein